MRVGLDLQAAREQRTGIGSYAAELAAALPGAGVEAVSLDWGRDPVMRLHRRLQWQQWELPRRARRTGVDLLHCTGFDAPLWRPLPTVLTVHDLIGQLFPENLPPVARWYWLRWLPWSVRLARQIIADSEHTRRDIVRLLGLPPERITVVPLAADRRFTPAPPAAVAELRARLGLPDIMALYVGTLEPRKGLDTLVAAWAELASELPDARLVLGGKPGWYIARLDEQIQRLGLAKRVQLLGYVADADLPTLYSAATVFAFPSRYEGFGLPPLEAMACGAPVITSDSSSLPEVVGDAGRCVAVDDAPALAAALRDVLASPALQAELRRRGLARAAEFTWQRTAALTAAVYRRALGAAA